MQKYVQRNGFHFATGILNCKSNKNNILGLLQNYINSDKDVLDAFGSSHVVFCLVVMPKLNLLVEIKCGKVELILEQEKIIEEESSYIVFDINPRKRRETYLNEFSEYNTIFN